MDCKPPQRLEAKACTYGGVLAMIAIARSQLWKLAMINDLVIKPPDLGELRR